MKILFLRMASYFNEKNAHPENISMPVDIGIMASIADHLGHETLLADTEARDYTLESLVAEIKRFDPDVIAIKGKSPSNQHIIDLFSHSQLERMKFKIIGFGHTFSTLSEFFLNTHLPFFCTISHEPELSFREILKRWDEKDARHTIKGITFREGERVVKNPDMPLLDKLDELPSPKYDWFLNENYYTFYPLPIFLKRKIGFILASRGCPMKCIYCSPTLRQTSGTGMRFHSIERIVSDMKYIQDKGHKIIMFRDDILTLNRKFIEELCQGILKANLKIKWMAQTHINHVDEDLLVLMKKAGCVTLAFGLESGSKKVLTAIKKYNDLDHARKIFPFCKKIGMKTVGFFLVGNPGETLEDVELTKKLIRDLNPDLIQVAMFTPYKGSPSYEMLKDQEKDSFDKFHHYNKITHNFSAMRLEDIEGLSRKIYLEYIFTPRNFVRFSLQSVVDLFINQRSILQLIRGASKYLLFRKVS